MGRRSTYKPVLSPALEKSLQFPVHKYPEFTLSRSYWPYIGLVQIAAFEAWMPLMPRMAPA